MIDCGGSFGKRPRVILSNKSRRTEGTKRAVGQPGPAPTLVCVIKAHHRIGTIVSETSPLYSKPEAQQGTLTPGASNALSDDC
jgi:hypothetical protein